MLHLLLLLIRHWDAAIAEDEDFTKDFVKV